MMPTAHPFREENKSAHCRQFVGFGAQRPRHSEEALRPMPLRNRKPVVPCSFCHSCQDPAALAAYSHALAEHLAAAAPEFCRRCYTFNRTQAMAHRRFVVAADSSEAAKLLLQRIRCVQHETIDVAISLVSSSEVRHQYVNMAQTYIATSLFGRRRRLLRIPQAHLVAISANFFIPK